MYGIFQWGVSWLLLGLVFKPYEGGIKKDHATVSYYFLITGLGVLRGALMTYLVALAASLCTKWRIILRP